MTRDKSTMNDDFSSGMLSERVKGRRASRILALRPLLHSTRAMGNCRARKSRLPPRRHYGQVLGLRQSVSENVSGVFVDSGYLIEALPSNVQVLSSIWTARSGRFGSAPESSKMVLQK